LDQDRHAKSPKGDRESSHRKDASISRKRQYRVPYRIDDGRLERIAVDSTVDLGCAQRHGCQGGDTKDQPRENA
jgi:hypothetical protein